jgi:hypothetical protein
MRQRTEWLEDRVGVGRPLATGTLACPACDAPVLLAGPSALRAPMQCSYCGESGLLRDFLSLEQPTRPAHVVLRVRA